MSLSSTLSIDSIVVADEDQMSSKLDNETIILDKKLGIYFGLNHVGASIWELIQEPKTIATVRDLIATQYQIQAEQCESDILELLAEMEAEKLIKIQDEMVV